ncbi:M20/M25/M40 family metallo-hydrolase [Aureibaculum sp. 2210JD6-5]|uniref:M20/M25/M40 family metallo-hydrolase n=1 Tax=Aureibaculum sp. 2210JD6-5 TaxID=3103957 RepID=UPI002AAC79B4|nr:M20/M25/M40 family metallo-hydrolase [Aureibaculum sp. 2210JD6-5]MDY7396820.1 M20/M25/M40 family metallo-hydrolase [Aureibaculum sp. 2210JD6-5]
MKPTINIFTFCFGILIGANIYAQETAVQKQYSKEVAKLVKHKKVQSAYKIIEDIDEQTVKDMIQLTEVIAPPFKETKRGLLFKKMIEEAGADSVWVDKVGNVLALRKGKTSEKLIALDAHLDVVFPEGTDVTVKKVGDTLKAPGIGDDSRGLSMVIAVLKAMNRANIETKNDILFVGSVGEEGLGDLRGMKYIFNESDLKIDSWIAIDGGNIGRILNAALGSKRYKVVLKGKGGHSWGAFGLANPHHALGKVIDEFSNVAAEYTSTGPKTSFNISVIGGGTSVNSIPFESWMEVDMRSVSAKRLNEIEIIFKNSVTKAVDAYNASGIEDRITAELIKIGDRPSGELSPEIPLIQRAMAATKSFGVEPRLSIGSTNASIPIAMNIPAICIGRGGKGDGAHSLDEWFVNENGAEAIKLAMLIILAEAEISK